jgi:hypothetical protein
MKTCTYCCYIIIFAFIASFAIMGCSNHNLVARPVTSASAYPSAIEKAQKDKRYFIMQSGINIYTITSVDLDKAKQQMTVTLDKVDALRLANFKNPATTRSKAIKSEQASQSEIHLFMRDSTSYTLDEPHTIPLNNIARVELSGND